MVGEGGGRGDEEGDLVMERGGVVFVVYTLCVEF